MQKTKEQMIKDSIGMTVFHARMNCDMTQQELADRLGKHVSTISGIEQGRRFPSIKGLFALAEIFQVRVEALLGTKYHK